MDWSKDAMELPPDQNLAPMLPLVGGAGAAPAPDGYAAAPYTDHAQQVNYAESEDEDNDRPADDDFDPEEEFEEDAEAAADEEEEVVYDEDDEEEEEDSEEECGGGTATGGKRKRSGSADADLLLAQQLQSEWGGGSTRATRGAHPSTYAENSAGSDEEDDDEDDDEDEVEYADESEEEEMAPKPAPRPPAAVPKPTGTLKLKLRLPSPAVASQPQQQQQQQQQFQQQQAAAMYNNNQAAYYHHQPSATPSVQPGSYDSSLAQGTGAGTATATEQENEEEDDGYADWDDDTVQEQEDAAKRRRRVAPVLLSSADLATLDDEVELVISHRDVEGALPDPIDPWRTREFYVKWARYSHIHNSWDAYATLSQLGGFKRVLNYCRRIDAAAAMRGMLSPEEAEEADVRAALEAEIENEHSQVERIVAERVVPGDEPGDGPKRQFLCKWQGLPYSEVTWETVEDVERTGGAPEIEDFKKREAAALAPRRGVDAARRVFAESGERAFTEQPSYLGGEGTLRDYQLEGLNWMVYNWARNVNGILADEMGLGKTVQCASMIGYLSLAQEVGGPFIVIVPLSTVPNWAREFKKWIPDVNAVVYVGDTASREVIRHFEFPLARPTAGRTFKMDVIITTYELALKDAALLRNVRWSYMMVDEAHRLKNDESALYKELSQWNFKSKLLITGTPLQNNIRELWALLHFLQPNKFPSSETFEAEYDLRDSAAVQRLHAVLRPHLLRRVIKDVEKSLPPKNERILRVPMTPLQRQYYRWILTRNFKELNKNARGGQVKLLNIIVDLKKCCNHPFLFESARDNYKSTGDDVATRLVVTSGKMVLLDKLLRRLKETGHRVLIFSQMVRQLDIISEYMSLRGYRHQRLDGSTPAHKRHQAMERFNAPGSEDFAFLLSTRAGGLGINLATADTVLLFDSDWNPQNDLQAMSRAHRIGQKDIVNIYRLVTSGSVEEDILERAKRKMVLDHLVIQKMDTSGRTVLDAGAGGTAAGARLFGKDELAAILKFGAEDLFKEDEAAGADGADGGEGGEGGGAGAGGSGGGGGGSGAGLMTDEDLDAILARAEVVEQKEEAPGGASDLLSSFNVATFKADEDDTAFWNRLIPEAMRPKAEPEMQADIGIRAARLRAMESAPTVNPNSQGFGGAGGGAAKKKKKKPAEPGPPVEGALFRIDKWPQEVDTAGRLMAGERAPTPDKYPKTLARRDAASFLRAVKRHGLASKLDAIAEDAGGPVGALKEDALRALWHGLLRGCEKVVDMHSRRTLGPEGGAPPPGSAAAAAAANGSGSGSGAAGAGGNTVTNNNNAGAANKPPSEGHLDFFGFDVRAGEVLAFVRQMALLEGRLAGLPEPVRRLRLTMAERPAPTAWMRGCSWTPEDDTALLVGAWRHGVGAWDKIADDPELRLGPKLAGAAGREAALELPKASHLETRVMGLLRQMEKVAKRPPKPPNRPQTRPVSVPLAPAPHRPMQTPAEAAAAKAAADKAESSLGSDILVLVRKLRTLQRRGADMDASIVVSKTRKYMGSIGKRIDEVAQEAAPLRAELWAYVSRYTENSMSGDKLEHVFRRLSQDTTRETAEEGEALGAAAAGGAAAGGVSVAQQQQQQQQQQELQQEEKPMEIDGGDGTAGGFHANAEEMKQEKEII